MKFNEVIAQFEAAGISVLADGKHSRKLSFAGKHVGILYDSCDIGFCTLGTHSDDSGVSVALNFTRARAQASGSVTLTNNGVSVGSLSCRA